jgi:putative zinc finger/helix-turn-helix YgiT family protein
VHSATIPYDAKIKHDGKLHEFQIAALPIDRCEECNEEFFTNATSDAKSDALRKHLGLLQPAEIRELLGKHNLTQRKFAAHLRVAEESVSRWLNGLSIQSRALDTLMRVYFAKPEVRETLASETPVGFDTARAAGPTTAVTVGTQQLEPASIHPTFGRRFTAATIAQMTRAISRKGRLEEGIGRFNLLLIACTLPVACTTISAPRRLGIN